ncbi:MAG: DUF2183 domain-containing protein [Deltaproteobacteria bacterium]|nr:DUF2183 domain-containing protein [Deltaproteobacteria bacterium]
MSRTEDLRALLTVDRAENRGRRILDLLADSTAHELDHALETVGAIELLARVEDRLRGPKLRMELLRLLGKDRLPDLGVAARAAFVRALQIGRTSTVKEQTIRDVLLGTHGDDLTALKNVLDTEGGHRDLQRLVFRDVDDPALRAEILAHFRAEARHVTRRELKILSDVDDTFYANWKDARFPPKTVYPGVLALYRELDRGPEIEPGREGDLAFVTARPDDHMGIIERRTLASLRKRGIGKATVLSGSFRKIFGNTSIAEKKLQNFTQYEQLFPEYDFVFVGDSGQGDVGFGTSLLEQHPDRVRAVLIHDVVDTPQFVRSEQRRRHVHFFDTYVGAALAAAAERLIEPAGVERIARAAMEDFAKIRWKSTAQRDARWAELMRDVAAAGIAVT